jgi:hypothetical protein
MDLRGFYKTIREIEGRIREEEVVVISRKTEEGGRGGVMMDVPRGVAARLVAEQKVDLASEEEAAEFRAGVERKWKERMDGAAYGRQS